MLLTQKPTQDQTKFCESANEVRSNQIVFNPTKIRVKQVKPPKLEV